MSKLVGASFIALGTGGIALALLKDTKYDLLLKLGITKPKITSKIQQDFHCEVLFLKIATNYFQTFEINKKISDITKPPEGIIFSGGYQLNEETKKRVAELQTQHDKAQKLYEEALSEYNSSICGQEINAMDCIGNGNCLKPQELKSDCINSGVAYLTENKVVKDIESDLNTLNDKDFKFKWGGTKEFVSKTLPSKKEKVAILKKAYENCDYTNVDCVSLKEDIDELTDQYNLYKANPDSNRVGSPAKADMATTKSKLDIKKDIFDKTKCGVKQLIRTGVSYKDVIDCVQQDVLIKSLKDDIAYRENKKLELGQHWTSSSEIFLQNLKKRTAELESGFVDKGCKARFESQKLKENAILLTDMASQQETNVLKKNINEQYIYIGTGALILLTGFYMVLKK